MLLFFLFFNAYHKRFLKLAFTFCMILHIKKPSVETEHILLVNKSFNRKVFYY